MEGVGSGPVLRLLLGRLDLLMLILIAVLVLHIVFSRAFFALGLLGCTSLTSILLAGGGLAFFFFGFFWSGVVIKPGDPMAIRGLPQPR